MSLRATATEIPKLVRRLGSRRPAVVDAARARLAIVGERAVEALAECLEGDNARIRANAMPLLALIQDPRGREPLTAMLLDRETRMREIAARSLGRFPSPQAVCALDRLLKNEKVAEVRVAAVQALVAQYAAGQERAIRPVLEILFDVHGDARPRVAAMALLPLLGASERRGIVRRLRQDPSEEVSRKARDQVAEGSIPADGPGADTWLANLASADYAAWNDAVHRLASLGAAGVEPVVSEMRRRAGDPEYCARAGLVLKGLGPRCGRLLAEALDRVEEPLALQVLVEAIGAVGDKAAIYRLKNLIERIAQARRDTIADDEFDPMQRVRAKAHLELARVGSRLAIHDLREGLADTSRRLEPGMLAAIRVIGKKDEIPDLLRAFLREDRFLRERIVDVVRAIMKRERIRRSNRMFHSLSLRQQRALESILPPRRPRRPSSRRVPKR